MDKTITGIISKCNSVNSKHDLDNIIKQITFQNTVLDFKWAFETQQIQTKDVKGGQFIPNTDRKGWLIHVTFERPDTITGKIGRGRGRDEIIWAGATESAVVKTCWLLVELMVRHELMEGFNYQGRRIFNPHNTVQELISVQDNHENI